MWLLHYSRRDTISLPELFTIDHLSSFLKKVLSEMKKIDFGETKSYQELAKQCGRPAAARAVGGACGRNPFPLFFPCHRIIRANHSLGGFALDLEIKRRLLQFETAGSLLRSRSWRN